MPFAYKATFTVQGSQMPSSQTDFPFIIYWTDPVFRQLADGGQVTDAQGDDIRPYSDTGLTSALTYQKFYYAADASNGTIGMVVKHTGGVGTVIYLGIGDSGITTDGSSTSVWDASTKNAWHFGTDSSLALDDWTSTNNDLSNTGGVTATAGIISGAALLANDEYLFSGSNVGITGDSARTISGWFRLDTLAVGGENPIFLFGSGADQKFGGIWLNDGSVGMRVETDTGADMATGASTLAEDTWYHLAFTYAGGGFNTTNAKLYVDGVSQSLTGGSGNTQNTSASAIDFGHDSFSSVRDFIGAMDEIRTATTARSADWIMSEYKNQVSQANFWGTPTFAAVAEVGPIVPKHTFNFMRIQY